MAPTGRRTAERRQITAMFCELVGAPHGEAIDLEARHEAVEAFRSCVTATIGRHSGYIARSLSGTVLALFGYPAAHEHDAEHAVRAGLELCSAVGALRLHDAAPVRCRVGIATDFVIVGDLTSVGEQRDCEIIGDAPGLAMRLAASSEPDTVAIGPTTRRLIGNLFDCHDCGTTEADNGVGPVRCWRVLRENAVGSRFDALRGPALTPLIGRDEEIELLLRRWARAKAGEGQSVLIAGEPGIGKSRLIAAAAEHLHSEKYVRLCYFCSPHHLDSALSPVIDQLGRASGFARGDPPAVKRAKLEALLAAAGPSEDDVALLADLLSLPGSERHPLPNLAPRRKKERTIEALIRQLEGLARRQPVMVTFEDAHWIDPTSRELLDLAIERLRTLPVLLIVTFRPEFQPPWTGQPQVTVLALARLDRHDRHDRVALIGEIAGSKALPEAIVDEIAERTDGIPLFVEELTKSVLESAPLREEAGRYVLDRPLPPLALPMTLHASLMARLDRSGSLPVAQTGAAIGREFSYELLRAVSPLPDDTLRGALARLAASELVLQRGTPPYAVYRFKHALVQDAAHGSLVRHARQRLHRQIAETLRGRFPELMENQPELLARHYAEAGMAEESAFYWGKAADRSLARSAMTEAMAQLQEGLGQLALLPKTFERQRQELEFHVALGTAMRAVKGFAAPEVGHAWSRARELWESLGCPQEFINIPFAQAAYHGLRHERDLAISLIEEVLRLSHQRNDASGLVLAYSEIGQTLMFAGEFASSRTHLERALAVHDPIFHPSLFTQHPLVPARGYLAIVLLCLGYPDRALAERSATIAEAQRLDHPASLILSQVFNAILLSLVGDDAAVDAQATEVITAAIEQGFALYRAQGTIFRGWAKVKHGKVSEGIHLLRGGSDAYRATGSEAWMPHYRALMAAAFEITGKVAEALSLLDDALTIAARTGERWFTAELNRIRGQFLLREGRYEAAEEQYRQALGIAQEQEARFWELRAAVSLARLWRNQGRRTQARDLLAPISEWFTEGFGTPDLKEAKALLEELARAA